MARAKPHSFLANRRSRHDVALDLGTANTLMFTAGAGIVLNQPSVVCFERRARERPTKATVAAVGAEAKELLGRTPANLETVRPLSHGVIADFSAAEHMMRRFAAMAQPQTRLGRLSRLGRRASFTVCVPEGATHVERRAIREAAFAAGAARVSFIDESLASALGAGLPVDEPTGSMVVDIGGGTTEVGILALGGVVCSGSVRVGGDQFDRAIVDHVRALYDVVLGEQTAEHVKKIIGSALHGEPVERARATGRSLADGLPRTIELTSEDIADALAAPLRAVIGVVRQVIETAPPELVTDIAGNGIVLTGGGALLGRLDQCLAAELGVAVRVADEPLTCAVRGAGAAAAFAGEHGYAAFD